jgi:hypothetical protein
MLAQVLCGGSKPSCPKVTDLFLHLEAVEQYAVAAHMQVGACSASTAFAPVGKGAYQGRVDGDARFQCQAIERSLEGRAARKQMPALLAPSQVQHPERQARIEGQPPQERLQVSDQDVDLLGNKHEIDSDPCPLRRYPVAAEQRLFEAGSAGKGIAACGRDSCKAHSHFCAAADQGSNLGSLRFVRQRHPIGKDSEAEPQSEDLVGQIGCPGYE